MSVLTDLQQFVVAQPNVTAQIGTRLYPLLGEPNDILPFMVYTAVSTESIETHDGASGLDATHVQFSCYAKTYEAARTLRDILKTLLQGFVGTLTPGTTYVGNTRYVTERDIFETTTRVYCTHVEFLFWHSLNTNNP